jgi:hypothetical protein
VYLLEDELSQLRQRELAARSRRAEERHRHALRLADASSRLRRGRRRSMWAR